jgi:hypothetical protein
MAARTGTDQIGRMGLKAAIRSRRASGRCPRSTGSCPPEAASPARWRGRASRGSSSAAPRPRPSGHRRKFQIAIARLGTVGRDAEGHERPARAASAPSVHPRRKASASGSHGRTGPRASARRASAASISAAARIAGAVSRPTGLDHHARIASPASAACSIAMKPERVAIGHHQGRADSPRPETGRSVI